MLPHSSHRELADGLARGKYALAIFVPFDAMLELDRAITDLPIEHFDSGTRVIRIGNQNALWTEATMNHLLVVGKADHFGDLAN